MAFRFPLESVLRLRVSHERQEQARLETAAGQLQLALGRCEFLKKEKLELDQTALDQLRTGMTPSELHLYRTAKAGLERAETEAAQALEKVRAAWELQRLKFLEARRDREILTNARRRQFEAYLMEYNRREQQQIDDLFAMRRLRE